MGFFVSRHCASPHQCGNSLARDHRDHHDNLVSALWYECQLCVTKLTTAHDRDATTCMFFHCVGLFTPARHDLVARNVDVCVAEGGIPYVTTSASPDPSPQPATRFLGQASTWISPDTSFSFDLSEGGDSPMSSSPTASPVKLARHQLSFDDSSRDSTFCPRVVFVLFVYSYVCCVRLARLYHLPMFLTFAFTVYVCIYISVECCLFHPLSSVAFFIKLPHLVIACSCDARISFIFALTLFCHLFVSSFGSP